jgi:protoporphyrinogen oxidase
MGGISRTVQYKGNRMDIGGHRFFSKSDRVMNWWLDQLPQEAEGQAEREDDVMLVRGRKSRIYFLRKFFDYPIQLSKATLANLGPLRTMRIGLSYLHATLFPIRKVENLEQFFINRFGRELYLTFFKSYTEKVWGVPCDKISAEWGAQRIKGLSIRKAIAHFLKQSGKAGDIAQKGTETSLIEQFLYPKFGPGQMWEKIAHRVQEMGGEILTNFDVTAVELKDGRVASVSGRASDGSVRRFEGDYFFSTTSVKELVAAMEQGPFEPGECPVPQNVHEIASHLEYRDFIAVGLLVEKLKVREPGAADHRLVSDNWIYIQEPDVVIGRLQVFNNWSPYLVSDRSKVWLGAEYFCYEGDELWTRSDQSMATLAADELAKIDIIDRKDVLDAVVVRMPKTYPAYFGVYDRFQEVRDFVDAIPNLYLIGRNGMHKYNNQDHSMLTAMTAVDNIVAGRPGKQNIWDVNTEQDYHESKDDKPGKTGKES